MTLRFHEIAESGHRILDPFSAAKLDLLGEICAPVAGSRHLDLACGKGELLLRFAAQHGTSGVGVDISDVFLAAATERSIELGVTDRVELVQADAAAYIAPEPFDIVSCLGATWIGDGLVGTLALMRRSLSPGGTVLVGEPFWHEPPAEASAYLGEPDTVVSLVGTAERIEAAGFELVEMVLADTDDWDRYEAAQWRAVYDWLPANPDDPDTEALRTWIAAARRWYLTYGRRYLGWGVFVLLPR